ncbi:MAG: hypothetical protein WKF47_14425 [Geodermatophilaceae bacterium]
MRDLPGRVHTSVSSPGHRHRTAAWNQYREGVGHNAENSALPRLKLPSRRSRPRRRTGPVVAERERADHLVRWSARQPFMRLAVQESCET